MTDHKQEHISTEIKDQLLINTIALPITKRRNKTKNNLEEDSEKDDKEGCSLEEILMLRVLVCQHGHQAEGHSSPQTSVSLQVRMAMTFYDLLSSDKVEPDVAVVGRPTVEIYMVYVPYISYIPRRGQQMVKFIRDPHPYWW